VSVQWARRFEIEFLSDRPPGLGRSQAVYAVKVGQGGHGPSRVWCSSVKGRSIACWQAPQQRQHNSRNCHRSRRALCVVLSSFERHGCTLHGLVLLPLPLLTSACCL
jgi:hypothetical protein